MKRTGSAAKFKRREIARLPCGAVAEPCLPNRLKSVRERLGRQVICRAARVVVRHLLNWFLRVARAPLYHARCAVDSIATGVGN